MNKILFILSLLFFINSNILSDTIISKTNIKTSQKKIINENVLLLNENSSNINLNIEKKDNNKNKQTINKKNKIEPNNSLENNNLGLKNQKDFNITSIPNINLTIDEDQDWSIILLSILTLVIILSTTYITKLQINSAKDESINTVNTSLEEQRKESIEKIKIEVISKNRQIWINTLRDDLSKFIGSIATIENHMRLEENKESTTRDIFLSATTMREIKAKIQLLINPTEIKHQKLIIILQEIIILTRDKNSTVDKINELIDISQNILKEEWDRVKNFA